MISVWELILISLFLGFCCGYGLMTIVYSKNHKFIGEIIIDENKENNCYDLKFKIYNRHDVLTCKYAVFEILNLANISSHIMELKTEDQKED